VKSFCVRLQSLIGRRGRKRPQPPAAIRTCVPGHGASQRIIYMDRKDQNFLLRVVRRNAQISFLSVSYDER
jgi:hypothetical protein